MSPTSRGDRVATTSTTGMTIDRAVLMMAGTVVLIGTALAAFVSPWWLLLTAFVGLNLLQSSITGFCPAALVFGKLGLRSGCAFR